MSCRLVSLSSSLLLATTIREFDYDNDNDNEETRGWISAA
jgi:hypothetical protein